MYWAELRDRGVVVRGEPWGDHQRRSEFGACDARLDQGELDAERCDLGDERLEESLDTPLRRVVEVPAGEGGLAAGARQLDEPAASLRSHRAAVVAAATAVVEALGSN
jgi:hypothetical protein